VCLEAAVEGRCTSCAFCEDVELQVLRQRLQLYQTLRQRAAKECEIFTEMLEKFLVIQ